MRIRVARADDGMLLKQVRMRALADAPYAFGGPETLLKEQALPNEHWHGLARELAGEVAEWRDRCVSYFVFDDEVVCATGSSYVCDRVAGRAYFCAAWVDPRYRRRGIGRWIVREAMTWAIEGM